MKLGEIIYQYRKEHKYSMDAFANLCGLSKGYISMLEANKNPKTGLPITPTLETFSKIASGMGVTLDQLFSMCDEDQPIFLSASFPPSSRDDFFEKLDSLARDMTEDEKRQLLLAARLIVAQRSEK
jgi:transcriptional regulator with XRE-family HTH domain